MSLVGTTANYGGKQPDNSQGIKQFVSGAGTTVSWIYKRIQSNILAITPSSSKNPVSINNDLYVTGSIYNTSDISVKENVIPLTEDTVNNILHLNPVNYNFKLDVNKKKHNGFIAQDVEKYYPELINNKIAGVKSLSYIELIPILVSKIQIMQKELDELKQKI